MSLCTHSAEVLRLNLLCSLENVVKCNKHTTPALHCQEKQNWAFTVEIFCHLSTVLCHDIL